MPVPQQAPTPAEITINYAAIPPGQTGTRPLRLHVHDTFFFTMVDSGTLSIEFKDHSPFADGTLTVGAGTNFVVAVPGHYKFRCIRTDEQGHRHVIDPDDPNLPGGGGEVEVLPA